MKEAGKIYELLPTPSFGDDKLNMETKYEGLKGNGWVAGTCQRTTKEKGGNRTSAGSRPLFRLLYASMCDVFSRCGWKKKNGTRNEMETLFLHVRN